MSRLETSGSGPAARAGPAPARRIADAGARRRVAATGTVRDTRTVALVGGGTAYQCALDDGTGRLDLLFLGRSVVPGLVAGACCSVDGTVTTWGARLVIWNPHYRLEELAGRVPPWPPPLLATDRDPGPEPEPGSGRATAPELEHSDQVEAAGHFRLYLGAAAGVGKTMAMLDEGHRRRRRGADVVIGRVECHGRPVTRAHRAGLEAVPLRRVDYRGVRLAEMDLDAVLRRHPQVALVDELAHTNVPGSGRHDKRWQDVLELLESGVDVITTLNVQHLESIADAVERMTGSQVRERVPDWVVRRADQIELVDSSPEQLRRRMLHGNIYPPEQVSRALSHFFRTENLIGLRELALRFLADETEEELLEHLARYPTGTLWETAERIMVGVVAHPGMDAIVRRASRLAARTKGDLHAVHVRTGDGEPGDRVEALDEVHRLVSDVGGRWHSVDADNPAKALLDFARAHQVTQIVLGSSRRSRLRELLSGGSVVRQVTRLAARAEVDVHIIAWRQDIDVQGTGPPAGAEPGAAEPAGTQPAVAGLGLRETAPGRTLGAWQRPAARRSAPS